MLPSYFEGLVEYFVVPIGVLVAAYTINEQFRLKFSSGSDFYVFFVSLDLNSILVYSAYKDNINPVFRDDYLTVFVFLAVISLVFLGFTLKTQGRIDDWRSGKMRAYPLASVLACWVVTAALIPTHLFVFFGR